MVETRVVDASVQVESGFLSLFKPETFFIRISECGKSERESAREREREREMEWKILMLVLVWNRAACCLPFEICCPNEENTLVVDTEAEVGLYFDDDVTHRADKVPDKSLFDSFQQAVTPIVEFKGCDESCCRKKSNRSRWDKSKVTGTLVRTKRFPLHLDPLYQYRFLSRSGRELSPT